MKRFFYAVLSVSLVFAWCLTISGAAEAEGTAPIAENLELTTYRNVSVEGSLSAYAPEGGKLSFCITTSPGKGEIELFEDGRFVYTPGENKRGRDYFGYKATDEAGNVSQEATVIIRIEKQKKDVFYSDLEGSGYEYAAIALSEHDIFTGEQIGGAYCFYPDREVSRGEFLSMCMLVAGKEPYEAVLSTGYSDDETIPTWLKGYVTAAALCGAAQGIETESGSVFSADEPVTRSEAAVMLDRALGITKVTYTALMSDISPEVAQACANLSACGLMKEGQPMEETLTRGEAAVMLAAALEKR